MNYQLLLHSIALNFFVFDTWETRNFPWNYLIKRPSFTVHLSVIELHFVKSRLVSWGQGNTESKSNKNLHDYDIDNRDPIVFSSPLLKRREIKSKLHSVNLPHFHYWLSNVNCVLLCVICTFSRDMKSYCLRQCFPW